MGNLLITLGKQPAVGNDSRVRKLIANLLLEKVGHLLGVSPTLG